MTKDNINYNNINYINQYKKIVLEIKDLKQQFINKLKNDLFYFIRKSDEIFYFEFRRILEKMDENQKRELFDGIHVNVKFFDFWEYDLFTRSKCSLQINDGKVHITTEFLPKEEMILKLLPLLIDNGALIPKQLLSIIEDLTKRCVCEDILTEVYDTLSDDDYPKVVPVWVFSECLEIDFKDSYELFCWYNTIKLSERDIGIVDKDHVLLVHTGCDGVFFNKQYINVLPRNTLSILCGSEMLNDHVKYLYDNNKNAIILLQGSVFHLYKIDEVKELIEW